MSRKGIYYLLGFTVLVTVFYFLVKDILVRPNVISQVQPFSFINQDGQTVTQNDVAGKVYVAYYFFTTCTGICPKMNGNMKQVYEALKNEKNFVILAHSCDPARDTVATLKRFTDSLHIDTKKWIFLTGRKDSLYRTARISYTIDDPANNLKNIEDDFLHTQFWALVNQQGQVVKIFDGLKQSEVDYLISQAKKLLKSS